MLTTIVQVSSGPTTAEFIVSLLIVGVLGPGLGVLAGRWADRRKFAHERKLKASDDLIARIDDGAASLEELGEACTTMRQSFLSLGVADTKALWPLVSIAEDAYQRSRVKTARLGIRPYADSELLAKADEAASSLLSAVRDVRTALIKADLARATGKEPLDELPIGPVMEKIETGYTQTREYHARARVAVGNLLA